MSIITYNGKAYDLLAGRSVLESLVEQGVDIPYSCQQGICKSCLSKHLGAAPAPQWQKDLRPSEIQQNYFLPCLCYPTTDMVMASLDLETTSVAAQITHKDFLSPTVVALTLSPLGAFEARPGQYVTVALENGLTRSYSIANLVAKDQVIILHIRKTPQGQFSSWAFDKAQKGDRLYIRGPAGLCFYTLQDAPDTPMLLVGTGTGLAPLWAIAQDALVTYHHKGPIHLIHHGRTTDSLYLQKELSQLSEKYPNFHYIPSIQPIDAEEVKPYATLLERTMDVLKAPEKSYAYFCGNPTAVAALERKTFLAGMPLEHIFKDSFVKAAPPAAALAQQR